MKERLRQIRVCKRCSSQYFFYKKDSRLCEECSKTCNTCGIILTEENKSTFGKLDRPRYMCKSCVNTKSKINTDKDKVKDAYYRRTYGISTQDFDALYLSQGRVCLICKTDSSRLCVDHNHLTCEIRGILCNSCNTALGHFKDSKELLLNAYKYLEEKGDYYGFSKGER